VIWSRSSESGPGPDEGHPAGTVFLAVSSDSAEEPVIQHRFDGDPPDVVKGATIVGLQAVLTALERSR
jgi:nicotinamide-nucleotide amidase